MTEEEKKAFAALLAAAQNLIDNMDDMEESKNDDGDDWADVAELRAQIARALKITAEGR